MEFFKNDGARTGLFFGATSGVITTIGLITGLNAGTRSIAAVLGGIFVIADTSGRQPCLRSSISFSLR
jgi:hypothetical protein